MATFHLFCLLAAAACVTGSIVKTNNKNSSTFELLILHNNDMHARFEQTSQLSGACTIADRDAGKCYGGFPRVAHVVKEARRAASVGEGPPVLYLNAGDTYTGTAWFTIYKWKIAAEFINALQPDAVALGNNEIDVKTHKLSPFIENIKPTILASNVIINSVEETTKIEKSIVFDIDGTKIGVVGYLKLDASALDSAGTIEYVDEVIAIREEVENLKSEGINIIIALGHSDDAKDMDIAREVDGIDLVISGHKNTFFWNGTSHDAEKSESYEAVVVTQTSGKQVPVVHSYTYSKYLGHLSVKFDVDGEISSYDVKPILLDENISQNSDFVSVVENADVQVGTTSVVLDGDSCNVAECNFGNLVTDAMMYIYAINFEGDNWTDAPVAIIPAGSITASIAPLNRPAAVYETDLLKALSLESSVVAVTMSGTVLEQVLEQAVADFNPSGNNDQFLQFSGIRVTYDFSLPSGSRVTRAVVRCGSCFVPEFFTIDSWRDYKVLMPLALANGGYGYSMLTSLPRENVEFDEVTSVTKYMELRSPVYPEVAGRIRLLNVPEVEPEPTTPEVAPETEPPVTEPPVTEPPVTEPPVTEPPVTEAPVTEPPVTEAPVPGAATTLTTTITLFIVYLLTLVIM